MKFDSFLKSIQDPHPPANLSAYLLSLWYDAKGDWNRAHDIIQDEEDKNGSWIHAYLHRKEGDTWNADYWYRKAGRTRPNCSLEQEWEQIASVFVEKER